ncbi:platelet glycoprotein V-like [Rhincodon typus]|uniref:platelet glycoprotein V-like n=1 Tax=Rhincodon typus TaxID=259920 RepID=UPI0009A2E2EE|nr:platelet glycoprotein V-like [Rhincodon typus]XP_048451499.1 platelet glycoprotein V-like [Rhincodon typus]XP_048451500.1 platelet glycoprotein V-like [Rhincodon typus]
MGRILELLVVLFGAGVLSACPEKCFCHSKLVDCRGTALESIPVDINPSTQTLFLDGNSLTRIPLNSFRNLGQLNYLGLSSNCLLLQNNIFDPLPRLQALDLSANHLSELPEDLFGNLSNLTWLNLANNNLHSLHLGKSLTKLTYLDLSNNNLTVFQETFKHFPQLDTLFLNSNQLKTLPETGFSQLLLLKVLDLSNNELSSLPSQFLNHHHKLTDLRLDKNRFRTFTANLFSQLHHLQYLTISGNVISYFPPEQFANLTKLLKLDLSNNSLIFLPLNLLSNLRELQLLKLCDNFIDTLVADTFKYNLKLVYLHLDSNNLRSLPVFDGLSQLEELTLSFNRLRGFPNGFADNLVKLNCLQVTDNLIEQWDIRVFPNITSVLLRNNPICTVNDSGRQPTNIDCTKAQC